MSLVERGTRGHPRIRIRLIHLLVFAFGGAAALRWAPGVACGGGGVACGQRVVVGGWRRERGGEVARIRRRSISDGAHTLCCSSSRACLIRARRCRRLPGYRAGVCAADSAVGLCSSISLMASYRSKSVLCCGRLPTRHSKAAAAARRAMAPLHHGAGWSHGAYDAKLFVSHKPSSASGIRV